MLLRTLSSSLLLLLINTSALCLADDTPAPTRPQFSIDTSKPYAVGAIPAYTGSHQAIYANIDENIQAHTEQLQRWLRQPSISAENTGVTEMANLVLADFKQLGFHEAELVTTDGHPGVWAYYDAGAPKTLMVYMMYDVQPVNPADWDSPPFAANLVEHEFGKVIMARGASNQKGPQRALLNAVASILAVDGTLPVNLMVTVEGEEELGSPHYPQIIDQYESRLKTADGVIFPANGQSPGGGSNMFLGVKGIVYWELEASGGDWGGPVTAEIHGSYKAVLDSPVWRLIQALATFTSADGNTVLVKDFYQGIRPPTTEEQALIAGGLKAGNSDSQLAKAFGIKRWLDDADPTTRAAYQVYMPTLNIDGIYAGYTGPGIKTILPHKATVKMDSRIPVGIDPDVHLARIREHLDSHGYRDIELRKLAGYPAAQTSIEAPLVRAAIGVSRKYGPTPGVTPRIAGSAPFYQFTERLQLPMIPWGLGYGYGAHSPNEVMLIEPKEGTGIAGLADIEKSYVDLLFALAGK